MSPEISSDEATPAARLIGRGAERLLQSKFTLGADATVAAGPVGREAQAQTDAYVTADVKYHEFFDAEIKMVLADIGHYESEQFTVDLLHGLLAKKFPTFAVLKTGISTNPVHYY